MSPKRAATKRAPSTRAKRRKAPAALFLETTAQILRIAGTPEIQRGINELVDDSGKVGTSWFVRHEYEEVLVKFYRAVAEAARMLPHPGQDRPFEEMWREVAGNLPRFYPGGPNLFPHLNEKMNEMFRGMRVTPMELRNYLEGRGEEARQGFIEGELHDKSSCGVWVNGGSCRCDPEPGDACRLKETCVARRADFLASAGTVAAATKCAESKWLKANLLRLYAAQGKALLELLGKHPNPVGDLVIFWEVPDGWTLLTRDRCFGILRDAHRRRLKIYIVRLPRLEGGGECVIRPETNQEMAAEATVLNYTAKDVRVRLRRAGRPFELEEGDRVILSTGIFDGNRRGEVLHRNEAVFVIKLPFDTRRV